MQPEYLTPEEAIGYLVRKYNVRYSPRYFAKIRSTSSSGPVFVNLGRRIYYRPYDLDRWITSRAKPYRTTAERTVADARSKHSSKRDAVKRAAPSPLKLPPQSRDFDVFEILAGRPG